MKVLAPIRSFEEFEMLVENGAEELYCGMVPAEWQQRYGDAIWLNRRAAKGASIQTEAELRRLVDAAHARRVPVFVTLNAPAYTSEQLPHVLDCAARLDAAGADALIVTDMALLRALGRRKLNAALHVSSVAETLNSPACRFLIELGARRIILPRSLRLAEIRSLAEEVGSEVELEVFIQNGGCAFEEGLCFTTHQHPAGSFCTNLSSMQVEFESHAGHSDDLLRENLQHYQQWIWYLSGNGCSTTSRGLPYGPCGLCAIPEFQEMGIASAKIVGREASALRKLWSVRLVADIVGRARAQGPAGQIRRRARSLRGQPEHCDSGYMCYYRV